MCVGALGIARAGLTSVPIDPTAPAERVEFILNDVAASLLLSDTDEELGGFPMAHPLTHTAPVPDTGVDEPPADLASIVFTSGSTGTPKGIMVPAAHRIDMAKSSFFALLPPIPEGTLVGSLAAGTVGFAEALVHGVVHLGVSLDAYEIRRLGLALLAEWIERSGVAGFVTVPTVLRYFLPTLAPEKVFSQLQLVVLTGETATWEDVRQLRSHLRAEASVYNLFGLTESSGIALFAAGHVPAGASGRLPAGRLLPGVALSIVDEAGAPVPDGERGEIIVEGPGCAIGYWNRPELSAATFLPSAGGYSRVRTGDGGRLRPDGLLEHLGRLDHVVKIAGNRVELGEVESTLRTVPGVSAAVAAPYEDSGGNTRLVAFVVGEPDSALDPWVLRALLARRLPGAMVPDRVTLVDELPQLANGKVDRVGLVERLAFAQERREDPGDLEGIVASLFAEVLEHDAVGPDDDFFELGGDSMRAARVFVELEQRHSIVRPVSMLIEAPTARSLAAAIEAGASTLGLLLPLRTLGSRPPLFVVHDGTGDVLYATRIAEHASEDQPVYAIQAGLFAGDGGDEQTIEEVAARYVGEVRRLRPVGPYLLYGFSLGGVIAFEMARQLQAVGAEVSFLGLGDSSAPRATTTRRAIGRLAELRSLPAGDAARRLAELAASQLRHLAARVGKRERMPQQPWVEQAEVTLADGSDRAVLGMYHYGAMYLAYRPSTRFRGSVLLVRARTPTERADRGWGAFVTGRVLIRDIDAAHAELGKDPVAGTVGDLIAAAIDQARTRH